MCDIPEAEPSERGVTSFDGDGSSESPRHRKTLQAHTIGNVEELRLRRVFVYQGKYEMRGNRTGLNAGIVEQGRGNAQD